MELRHRQHPTNRTETAVADAKKALAAAKATVAKANKKSNSKGKSKDKNECAAKAKTAANVAYKRPASLINGTPFYGARTSYITDGNCVTCGYTAKATNPWYKVQLPNATEVGEVQIWNWDPWSKAHLPGTELWIDKTKCGMINATAAVVHKLDCKGIRGNVLTLIKPGKKTWFAVCEVLVFKPLDKGARRQTPMSKTPSKVPTKATATEATSMDTLTQVEEEDAGELLAHLTIGDLSVEQGNHNANQFANMLKNKPEVGEDKQEEAYEQLPE